MTEIDLRQTSTKENKKLVLLQKEFTKNYKLTADCNKTAFLVTDLHRNNLELLSYCGCYLIVSVAPYLDMYEYFIIGTVPSISLFLHFEKYYYSQWFSSLLSS